MVHFRQFNVLHVQDFKLNTDSFRLYVEILKEVDFTLNMVN